MEQDKVLSSEDVESLDCCFAHMVLSSTSNPSIETMSRLVHIRKRKTSVGRDRNAVDVYLDSNRVPRMISRIHAYIIHGKDGNWYIRDNKSVNGVFLNNVKVFDSVLQNEDRITFGGGGNLARGTYKHQPRSEFNFIFIIHKKDSEVEEMFLSTDNLKKRDDSQSLSDDLEPWESKTKRLKS